MSRTLSHMLVALALLMQIGVGVLPVNSGCSCPPPRTAVPACCAHKAAAPVVRTCCKHTCPHPSEGCVCTPTVSNPVAPTVQPRTVSVPVEVVAAPILTPRPVLALLPRACVPEAPAAHESPPGLPRAVNLPLLL